MDRDTLSYFLNSGSSRVFNPRKISDNVDKKQVFRIPALNQCFYFKYPVIIDASKGHLNNSHPIVTLAYYPYDRKQPILGGESFVYESETLNYYLKKFANISDQDSYSIEHDHGILNVLDSIPTFSPFLLKEAFERANINLDGMKFEITEKETAKIKQSLRNRLRPLVGFAFGGGGSPVNRQAIESLTDRLWKLDDMKSLQPLIEAFRMPQDRAKELFYGWTGITFFEQEYVRLQPSLRELAHWFALAAKPKENLPSAVSEPYKAKLALVKGLVRDRWRAALVIIEEYSTTYEQMLASSGNAAGFVKFLNHSTDHFWTLGAHLSRLDHSIEILQKLSARYPNPPYPYDFCEEVLSIMQQTLGNTEAPGTNPDALRHAAG